MSFDVVNAGTNDLILQFQSLYRGIFVRRSISRCFSEFHHLSEDLGIESCSLDSIKFITSLWKRHNILNQDDRGGDDFAASGDIKDIAPDSPAKHSVQLNEIVPTLIERRLLNQDLKTVALEELKGQLSDLTQEKLWLENAILARIEYLTNC